MIAQDGAFPAEWLQGMRIALVQPLPIDSITLSTQMPRILVVDDSPTIRKMVRASLRPLAAFDFIEAGNGLEAIEQLALGPIALMILDLNMPDMHGIDVLKFIRRHPSSREVPVVVLTTRGDDSSRESALAAGATHYLTKPFVPQMLLSTARELLGDAAARLPS